MPQDESNVGKATDIWGQLERECTDEWGNHAPTRDVRKLANDPKPSDSRPDDTRGKNTEVQTNDGNRGRIPAPRLFTRAPLLGESYCRALRFEKKQNNLSTMTPHIKPLVARSKTRTGNDQDP